MFILPLKYKSYYKKNFKMLGRKNVIAYVISPWDTVYENTK